MKLQTDMRVGCLYHFVFLKIFLKDCLNISYLYCHTEKLFLRAHRGLLPSQHLTIASPMQSQCTDTWMGVSQRRKLNETCGHCLWVFRTKHLLEEEMGVSLLGVLEETPGCTVYTASCSNRISNSFGYRSVILEKYGVFLPCSSPQR